MFSSKNKKKAFPDPYFQKMVEKIEKKSHFDIFVWTKNKIENFPSHIDSIYSRHKNSIKHDPIYVCFLSFARIVINKYPFVALFRFRQSQYHSIWIHIHMLRNTLNNIYRPNYIGKNRKILIWWDVFCLFYVFIFIRNTEQNVLCLWVFGQSSLKLELISFGRKTSVKDELMKCIFIVLSKIQILCENEISNFSKANGIGYEGPKIIGPN